MNEVQTLQAENRELRLRLANAEQAFRALAEREVDSVAVAASSTPVLLEAAQTELRRSEELLRAVFEGARDAVLLSDDSGHFVNVNQAACELFGVSKQQLVGGDLNRFIEPGSADLAELRGHFRQAGHLRGKLSIVRADGSLRRADFNSRANILPGLHLSIIRDITDSERAEEALRESRYFLEEAQAVAHIGSWASKLGSAGQVFWSNECYRIFGVPEGSAIDAQTFYRRVHPDDRAYVTQTIRRTIESGTHIEIDHRIVRPDGEVRWVYARAAVERTADGSARRFIGVVQDITARKQVLEELRASEQRYRRIIETTSEGVFMIGPDARTTFVNQRMAQMLGMGVDDALGLNIFDFLTGGHQAVLEREIEAKRPDFRGQYELQLQRASCPPLWVSLSANALLSDTGHYEGVLAMASDISERKRAEELKGRLAAIVESSDDAIMSNDLAGNITDWNQSALRLFGYSGEEIAGRPLAMLTPRDRAHEFSEVLLRIAEGQSVPSYESVGLRKDGTPIDISVKVSPIRDSRGDLVGTAAIKRDLSDRRRAERALRQTEDQLRQAQKMEAIGRLAGGIAHDFNNLLSVILSYSTLACESLKPGDPMLDDLGEIRRAGQRATDLTRQLLAFSRKQVLAPAVLDLNVVVSGMEKMLRRLLGEDIELRLALCPELSRTLADQGQIEQVLMNLAVNARDAMPNGGRLTIETANTEADVFEPLHVGRLGERFVTLTVTDTGVGMDEATRSRIFEPFFTTKETGKGTGLGLCTVLGIVQQSGGQITVHSKLGEGTRFRIYLSPTALDGSGTTTRAEPASMSGRETILLAEDDPQVRALVCSILRRHGYDVLAADSGHAALLLCDGHPREIDLLLTDVIMPRMSGKQLADRLTASRPGTKVLFMSGYTDDAIVHHGVLEAGIELLCKPLSPEALTRKVRQVLDKDLPGPL